MWPSVAIMRHYYLFYYSYGDIVYFLLHITSFVSLEEVKNHKAHNISHQYGL